MEVDMGSRNYRHREPKKGKKDTKKLPEVSILPKPVDVEVVKKRKKREEEQV
jgi:hypothetical protein